jgi:hypothetical protein
MQLPRAKQPETEIKYFKFYRGISQPEFDICGISIVHNHIRYSSFKENGLVNSGQPENFVETRSQKGKYLARI